jgi:hypothetical protein
MGLADYQDDYQWDSTGHVNSLATIRASLPKVVTSGSTIVIDGKPQFKSPASNGPQYRSGEEARQQAMASSNTRVAATELRQLLAKRLESLARKNQPINVGELSLELGEVSGLLNALSNLEPNAELQLTFEFDPECGDSR